MTPILRVTRARTLWLCLAAAACSGPAPQPGEQAGDPAARPSRFRFTEVTAEAGLEGFHQVNGEFDKRLIIEATGAGVALFDYDGDGDLDVFLVNGKDPRPDLPIEQQATNALYLNEGDWHFKDVTAEAGLLSRGSWGQGCSVADVNGDGHLDLYVTNQGKNVLYLNNGDGTFRDGTAATGVGEQGWSTGSAFLDYDRDGDLDLYVAKYIEWEKHIAAHPGGTFRPWKGYTVLAGPKGLPGAADRFYRNDGGTYHDVSAEVGLDPNEDGYGFQVSTADYDNDGDEDIFVANDSSGNFLLRNDNGRFTEVSLAAGVKHQEAGIAQACMGVAFDDYDCDGLPDIFITNFSDDVNVLYHNQGEGYFVIDTAAAGLNTQAAFKALGWGTFFFDADSDGHLDLYIANGHVFPTADKPGTGQMYRQKNFLFAGVDDRQFEDVSEQAGPGLQVKKSSRGAAFGDLDNDGDLDIVINNIDDTPTVLRNDSPGSGRWLKVELRGAGLNTSAIGSRVLVTAGGKTQSRELRSSDSFFSVSDHRLHFGLGSQDHVDRLEVWWPDGSREVVAEGLGTNRLVVVQQCAGLVEERLYPFRF